MGHDVVVIFMGRAPELQNYRIDAKSALNKKEINLIKECVRNHPEGYIKFCADSSKYSILMEL